MNQILNKWKQSLLLSGTDPDLIQAYLTHVATQIEQGVPPILDFNHLTLLLGRQPWYLASVVNGSYAHYRTFEIKKRRGGKRKIAAPFPALLECQQWINLHILRQSYLSPNAHGFCPSKSILTNAQQHLGQAEVLQMDLKDFFPSIPINRIIYAFKQFGYSRRVAVYLARICCLYDALPQGAATSPALSNIVARKLDSRLAGLASRKSLAYSRYADDLAFSGDRIESGLPSFIAKICKEEGFEVNYEKTRLYRNDGARIITGISVRGTAPKVPRAYKRKLRQEVHFVRKYGLYSHVRKKKIREPFFLQSLIGKLQFWLYVEPDCQFASQAVQELKALLSKSSSL